ncbi:hypothetical protein PG985_010344 [Apiospora marii]|uniref:uncharacterized protein n=1 Tax=Apiospora marii TaxID=335849 RepID=UPI003130C61F
MDDPQVWQAATAQLPISLHPDEFMPEILDFSLHFEPTTLQTPVAMRELGIGACYFRLHACIDNADTGHTAIALDIVVRYLEIIRKAAEGTGEDRGAAVKMAQRRVEAGYVLSHELGRAHGDEAGDNNRTDDSYSNCSLTDSEANTCSNSTEVAKAHMRGEKKFTAHG